jgi:hypothetical protein
LDGIAVKRKVAPIEKAVNIYVYLGHEAFYGDGPILAAVQVFGTNYEFVA